MSTKKTAKPQAVTFYRGSYCWRPASVTNEAGTVARELESIAIYDAAGVMCWLDSCELGDRLEMGDKLEMQLPIIWKTFKAPDYTETRAHIVGRDYYNGERKYTLFIPAEAVSVNPCAGYSVSKSARYVRRFFAVDGFPRKFGNWCHHPFDAYKLTHELESLKDKAYNTLSYPEILTDAAQARINEFMQTVSDFTAEAQRIHDMSESDYIRECGAINPRFNWKDGSFYRIKDEEPAA